MEVSRWWAVLCIAVNIITIIILIILTKREGKTFKDLINHSPHKKKSFKEILIAVPMMFVLGIGGLWGFSYLIYGYMPVINTQPLPIWSAIIVLVFLPITIVFAEMPLYLGYCVPIVSIYLPIYEMMHSEIK